MLRFPDRGSLKQSIRHQLLITCVGAFLLFDAATGISESGTPAKISPRELTRSLTSKLLSFHYGAFSVGAGQVLDSSIAVAEGALDLSAGSLVKGEVWVINGNLILGGDAHIDGTVHLVNGSLFQSKESTISGTIQQYRCECRLDQDRYHKNKQVAFRSKVDPKSLKPRLVAGAGPDTRVDYSTVFIGVARGNPENPRPHWRGDARLIVPFRENTRGFVGFDAGLQIPLTKRGTTLHVEGFKKTVTNDDWQFTSKENSAALILTHNDFLDYYERSGAAIGVTFHPSKPLSLDGGIYLDHSQSLSTRGVASLANNRLPLRDNPAVDRSEIFGTMFIARYDTRDDPLRPSSAIYGQLLIDAGWKVHPGDFDFATVTLDLRRYNRLWWGINLDMRGRLFTATRDLPRQRLQALNGYGGVRGLHDIPFPDRRGDRLALLSAELRVPLPAIPVFKIVFTRWDMLLFADAGILRLEGGSAGAFKFLNTDHRAWGKSVGFGISGESFLPYVGLYVAQDLDGRNKHPRFIIRAERSF